MEKICAFEPLLLAGGGLRVEGGRVYSVGRQSQKLPANDPARKSSGVNVL